MLKKTVGDWINFYCREKNVPEELYEEIRELVGRKVFSDVPLHSSFPQQPLDKIILEAIREVLRKSRLKK